MSLRAMVLAAHAIISSGLFLAGFDYIAFNSGQYDASLADLAFSRLGDMHVSAYPSPCYMVSPIT